MRHPLIHLIATQPHLLAEHGHAYADLLAQTMAELAQAWRTRALLVACALCGVGVGVVLGGVSIMLWATTNPPTQALWALVGVPLLPLLAAAACGLALRRNADAQPFDVVRTQLQADWAVLRAAAAP